MATEPSPPAHVINTTKLFTHVAQRAIDRILDLAEAKVKEKWARHKNRNKALFVNYMKAQSKRCAFVRTLIYDKQSAYLPDIYVKLRATKLDVTHRNVEVTTQDVINLLGEERDNKAKERRTLAAGAMRGSW
jgi:hypothetical protein